MTLRSVVLDASALFARDTDVASRAMAEALAAVPSLFASVVRIDDRGFHPVPPAALAARVADPAERRAFESLRAWLLGQGSRPPDPAPSPRADRLALFRRGAPAVRLPHGAAVLIPDLAVWDRAPLATLRRDRPDLSLLALIMAPPALDWPEYETEAGAAERRLAAIAVGASAIAVPDEVSRDRLHALLAGFCGGHAAMHVVQGPSLLPASGAADADAALQAIPYVLAVGRIEAGANVALLLHIWRDLIQAGGPVPRLVLAGTRGAQVEEIRPLLAWNPAIRAHVAEAPGLSAAALGHLARCARAVLAPAFTQRDATLLGDIHALGTPVIAADTPEMRPAGGATLLSPIDGPGWRAAIRAATQGPGRRLSVPAARTETAAYVAALAALEASP